MYRFSRIALVICLTMVLALMGASHARALSFTVNTTDDLDDGGCDAAHCSLREAVNAANASPGLDLIGFDLAGAAPHTITILSSFPVISDAVTIDGTTEPDYAGAPVVAVNMSQNGGGFHIQDGIAGYNGNGSTIRGLAINCVNPGVADDFGLRACITLFASNDNVIAGNYIGTDITGTLPMGGASGVRIVAGENNRIGGTDPADRNVIGGNRRGVWVFGGTDNLIQGNYIGTDPTGTVAVPNLNMGILLNETSGNQVGPGNVISGNASTGLMMFQDGGMTEGNVVTGNLIGTDASGTAALGNGMTGIQMSGDSNNNRIGGATAAERNVIAFNGDGGIEIAAPSTGNRIQGNSIYENVGRGIDLGDDSITPNDLLDADSGANSLQNFPVITDVRQGSTITLVEGTLNSLPNRGFSIEIFANDACDTGFHGEGKRLLGSTTVTTDAEGNGVFSVTVPLIGTSIVVTGTATDLATGSTSEFSECQSVTGSHAEIILPMREMMIDLNFMFEQEDFCPECAQRLQIPVKTAYDLVLKDNLGTAKVHMLNFNRQVNLVQKQYSLDPKFGIKLLFQSNNIIALLDDDLKK